TRAWFAPKRRLSASINASSAQPSASIFCNSLPAEGGGAALPGNAGNAGNESLLTLVSGCENRIIYGVFATREAAMSHLNGSLPIPVTYAEMANSGNELPGWLWQGFIAFGSITLLTSRWKTGKTTLLSVLVSRMRAGGALAGSETAAGPALVVSEESPALWVERGRNTPFGPDAGWLCQPFGGKPSRDEWFGLVRHLSSLAAGKPTLIVIDPLSMVLPSLDENNAGIIIDSLAPLRPLATAG